MGVSRPALYPESCSSLSLTSWHAPLSQKDLFPLVFIEVILMYNLLLPFLVFDWKLHS